MWELVDTIFLFIHLWAVIIGSIGVLVGTMGALWLTIELMIALLKR